MVMMTLNARQQKRHMKHFLVRSHGLEILLLFPTCRDLGASVKLEFHPVHPFLRFLTFEHFSIWRDVCFLPLLPLPFLCSLSPSPMV